MAMTYTGNGDLFLAAALNQMIHELLVDKTDLRALCVSLGDLSGSGSTVSKIRRIAPDDAMSAANTDEVTGNSAVDLANSSVNVTVARQALLRQVSDLYDIISGGEASIQYYAQDMVNSAILRFTDMVCALFSSLATSVGTTGTNFSVDNFYSAQYSLIQNRVAGPFHAVLAPIQLTDFQDSLRGEQGAVAFQGATDAMLAIKGPGFAGNFHGIDVYSADSVPTSGGDRHGAMFGHGCFGYAEAMPKIQQGAGPGSFMSVIPAGSPIFVEFERDAAAALTKIVGNYYVGVVELEDLRGVRIVTSAT